MALRKVFFDRPRKPFDCLMTFLCRAWVVTPRLTRAIVPFLPSGHSQEVLENDPRVAVLEDLRAAVRPLHLLRPPAKHEIGRAHVGTPVTNAHIGCRLLPEKKN